MEVENGKKKTGRTHYLNSAVPFAMQTFEIMKEILAAIHNNFYNLRCGRLDFVKSSYAALSEFYYGFLRPILPLNDIHEYDKKFDDIMRNIDENSVKSMKKAAYQLLELETDLMYQKQERGLGIMVEKAERNRGIASPKYMKDID